MALGFGFLIALFACLCFSRLAELFRVASSLLSPPRNRRLCSACLGVLVEKIIDC